MSEVLVHVTRGNQIESIHRGHIVVADPQGKLLYQAGDPGCVICLRSCGKPLQALPVITTGAADRFHFSPAELAVMCGSLSGQDFHVQAITSILDKIGLDERSLHCGIHRPSHRPTAKQLEASGTQASPLHNNCAGKHAAMLALCVHQGWPLAQYTHREHPVQQLILNTVASLTEVPVELIGIGIDGCGVPVFFLPIAHLARAYAKLTSPADPGISRLMTAALSYPEMIAGDERICTDLMVTLGKKVFAKTGAEGGYAMSLMEKGWGVGIKIEDGNNRALYPVIVETLRQLQMLEREEEKHLQSYHHPLIVNHVRERVGRIEVQFKLVRSPLKKTEKRASNHQGDAIG